MDKKTKSSKDKKREKVATLSEKIARSKSLAFAAYHGLSANQINTLRQKIKEAGGEMLVEKNTLLSRALTKNKLPVTSDQLIGPTSVIFAYDDEISPIKQIAAINKETGFPTFKFGFLGQDVLDASALEKLSTLPTKEQLRAKVVGSISSPIYGFVNVLFANMRNLVSVLDQIAQKSMV